MDDSFIQPGLQPPLRPRGVGPGLILLLATAIAALAAVQGYLWLRQRSSEIEPLESAGAVPLELIPVPAPEPPPSPAGPPSPETPPSAPGKDPALALFERAMELHESGSLTKARTAAYEALDAAASDGMKQAVENLLGRIHTLMAFTPVPMEEKVDYTIQPGDTLAVIARRHGVTLELLTRGNQIKGDLIRPGDRLRILRGEFSVVTSKTRNDLAVFLDGRFFKRYRVGTGRYERTPAGSYKITERIAQPTWYRPDGKVIPCGDKENELGTHWLSLDLPGYGIHGTWEPETIGKQASAGCIRLLNEDIGELYALLPVGTPVVIEE